MTQEKPQAPSIRRLEAYLLGHLSERQHQQVQNWLCANSKSPARLQKLQSEIKSLTDLLRANVNPEEEEVEDPWLGRYLDQELNAEERSRLEIQLVNSPKLQRRLISIFKAANAIIRPDFYVETIETRPKGLQIDLKTERDRSSTVSQTNSCGVSGSTVKARKKRLSSGQS